MSIHRWDWDYEGVYADQSGEYVLFTDHEGMVAGLRAELKQIKSERDGLIKLANRSANEIRQATGAFNRISEEASYLRAELAAKSKDAARYLYIRDSMSDDAVELVSAWSDLELDQAIDSRIGEGK